MKVTQFFASAVAALGLAASLSAQSLTYSLLAGGAAQPSPRFDAAIAYDPQERRIYLFGGWDTGAANDLWVYSLAQRRWEEIRTPEPAPAPRFGHTLVFDAARRRVVVFGGQARGFFNDVWAFDTASRAWRQLSAGDSGPSRRYGHSAVYDRARDRMVISHGFTNAGRFDDTWAFDFGSNAWRDLSPTGTRPLRRCLHHAALDEANEQMYLYGGCASGAGPCPLGDLWTFDLRANRWTERTGDPRPAAREHYGMGFDNAHSRLLIFGGNGGGALNDTWQYDTRSLSWRQAVADNAPAPRSRHESASTDRGTVFFFGGVTAAGPTNELWMLGPGFLQDAPRVAAGGIVNAFSGAGGAIAPGEIVSLFGTGLGPVDGIATGADPVTFELPRSGPGVDVTFNSIPAPLLYVSAGQINLQTPYEIAGAAQVRVVVTVNGRSSEELTVPVVAAHPGLFPRVWNQDGTVNSPENPAAPGSVIVLYAAGQGPTLPASRTGALAVDSFPEPRAGTSLTIGGIEAEILFRGVAPGTAGVMQVNARAPAGVAAGPAVPVVLTVGGVASQAGVSVAVR